MPWPVGFAAGKKPIILQNLPPRPPSKTEKKIIKMKRENGNKNSVASFFCSLISREMVRRKNKAEGHFFARINPCTSHSQKMRKKEKERYELPFPFLFAVIVVFIPVMRRVFACSVSFFSFLVFLIARTGNWNNYRRGEKVSRDRIAFFLSKKNSFFICLFFREEAVYCAVKIIIAPLRRVW